MKKDKSLKASKSEDESKKTGKVNEKIEPIESVDILKNIENPNISSSPIVNVVNVVKNINSNFQNNFKEKENEKLNEKQNEINEPKLTNVIVKSYEGKKENGLYKGYASVVYNNDNTYEGEFQDGTMSGRGRYFWATGVLYDGVFMNNEITGIGVYKWLNEESDEPDEFSNIYEGELIHGKRHGFGNFKSGKTLSTYIGEWNLGKRHGKGKLQFDAEGASYYEGDWIKDKRYGWGIMRYPSGNVYEGMWIKGVKHGIGTMRWTNKNQIYIGEWKNGVQNGIGESHWYLQRIENSQYELVNSYYGEFVNGERQGYGTFIYANGAKYEGNWKNNLKYGYGRFTFKNGETFDGYFKDDKITSPDLFKMNSLFLKDINRTKSEIHSGAITYSGNAKIKSLMEQNSNYKLDLDISNIILEIPETDRLEEKIQAVKIVTRYLDTLRKIYRFYSQLGLTSTPDNTYVLNRIQFWRFIKDCRIYNEKISVMEIDRFLALNQDKEIDIHYPFDKILLKDFFNYVMLLAFHMYKSEFNVRHMLLANCFDKLMNANIIPYACNVNGFLYNERHKTPTILEYMTKCYDIYKTLCWKKLEHPFDLTMTIRSFVQVLYEFKIINKKKLSTKEVIKIFAVDNPYVFDSKDSFNLDVEITFLEFFEALVGCASKYSNEFGNRDPAATPRPSTIMTREHSFLSEFSVITNNEDKQSNKPDENRKSKLGTQSVSHVHEGMNTSTSQATNLNDNQKDKLDLNQFVLNRQLIPSTDNTKNPSNKDKKGNDAMKDFHYWSKKIELFFSNKFFPTAENYRNIKQNMNKSI